MDVFPLLFMTCIGYCKEVYALNIEATFFINPGSASILKVCKHTLKVFSFFTEPLSSSYISRGNKLLHILIFYWTARVMVRTIALDIYLASSYFILACDVPACVCMRFNTGAIIGYPAQRNLETRKSWRIVLNASFIII